MKLHWAPQTRLQRAIRMLEEAGVEYEMELVDIRAADVMLGSNAAIRVSR